MHVTDPDAYKSEDTEPADGKHVDLVKEHIDIASDQLECEEKLETRKHFEEEKYGRQEHVT